MQEEITRDKLKIETGMRVIKYERNIRIRSNTMLKERLDEIDKELETQWGTDRKKYFQRNGSVCRTYKEEKTV